MNIKIKIRAVKEEYDKFKRLPLVEYLGVEKVNRTLLLSFAVVQSSFVLLIILDYIMSLKTG